MKIAFNPSTVAALIAPPNNKDITFDLRGHNIFARGVKFCGTDTNTWRDIKINNVSIGSNTLNLRNGSNTTLTNTNGVVTINSTWRPVVDNLTSDSTTSSLSAKQGKVLKSLIDGKSNSGHTHDNKYLKWLGNAGQSNMNAIGRISHSSGMTNLSDPGNTIDNPMEGGSKSTSWHLYWQTNYTDDPSGSNAWVAQIVNRAGTDRWWVRSRSGGTITNGTNWTSNWRFLVTAPTSGLGNGNQPVYINSAGEVVAANSYPTSLKNPHSLTLKANGTTLATYDGSSAKEANFTYANVGAASASHNHDDRYVRAFGTSNDNIDSDWGQSFKTFDPIPSGTPPEKNPNISLLSIGNNFIRRKQLAFIYNNDNIYYRRHVDGGFTNWRRLAFANEIPTSLKNPHALTISLNGTSQGPYDGSAAKNINITPGSIGAAVSNHTHTVFNNNLMIKGTNGISDSASIHLGIGDSDTGFKWISDGKCQIYADNVAVGEWTSGGMNWFKNPTVNGNKVWNAGNDGSGSGLDADTLDGYHENSFLRYRGFTKTDQEATLWNQIGIKEYQGVLPDGLTNIYNWGGVISLPGTYSRFEIYASHQSSSGNGLYYRSGWDSDKKSWLKFIDSSNIGSQSVNYANSAGNAQTLGGMPRNYGQAPFNTIPCIGDDGVMEIGRYIDFHYDNSGSYDYSTRLQTTGNYKNTVSLPSASGTLALTSDILNYYWANVKISASSSTTTSPTVSNLTATSSIRMGNILLQNTDEINSASGLHLNYRTSNDVILCYGGGNVGIGTSPSYKLDVNGQMRADGFHHYYADSNNYVLLAGGGYGSLFTNTSYNYTDNSKYNLTFHKLGSIFNNLVWVDGHVYGSTSTQFIVNSNVWAYKYDNSSGLDTTYSMGGNDYISVDAAGVVLIRCNSPHRVGFFYTGKA